MRFQTVRSLLLLGVAMDAVAQPPHIGAWTADYANSDRDELVLEFVDLGSGLWDFRQDGQHLLHFRVDDDRECSDCASEPWRTIGSNAWDTGWLSGAGRDIVRVAPDGDTLSWTSTRFVRTFERLSGGPGLAGQWRSDTERSVWAPAWIEISPGVDEWLVLKFGFTEQGTVCILLPDGADHPCFSPLMRAERTAAAKLTEARSLELVIKREGETVSEWALEFSLDGRSMTQTRRSATGRTISTLYHRRSP